MDFCKTGSVEVALRLREGGLSFPKQLGRKGAS